jgi:dolichyl-phosphate beta-glucosyltransferase
MGLVSVVIPVLNEDRLDGFVSGARAALEAGGHSTELIVVHDGGALPELSGEDVRLLPGPRRGKGAAVREGILAARGEVTFVVDADLEALFPRLRSFVRLVLRDGCDVVIAEREPDWHARGLLRFVLSYGLYAAQRLFVFGSRRFVDTQCGFKAFRTAVAADLARRQRVDGGMYDIEYLYIAVRKGMRIAQVPVGVVAESRPSKLRLWKCLRDPLDLLLIKGRGLTGVYSRK